MRQILLTAIVSGAAAASATATMVKVDIYGEVEYNLIRDGALSRTVVTAGAPVHISFLLDSNNYMNDPDGLPTRGYAIDQSSFAATYGPSTIGIQNPFPAGQTPMFVLRDNDPAVDGFFLSTGTAWDVPIPTNEPGAIDQLGVHFKVTYEGYTLSSLNIVDAAGSYDFSGLTAFYFSTDDGGFDAMSVVFDHMTIAVVPAPSTLALALPMLLVRRRRR